MSAKGNDGNLKKLCGQKFKNKKFEKQNLGEKVGKQKLRSKNLRLNLGLKNFKIIFGEKIEAKYFRSITLLPSLGYKFQEQT